MSGQITLAGNSVEVAGDFPRVGDVIADFALVAGDLSEVKLSDFAGKRKILNIFPSIDTGICATSVRVFNQKASGLGNTVVLCISADLPFAQSRFCGAEGLDNVKTLSTFRNADFAKNLGVAMVSGALAGLTARAVIALDGDNKVLHSELVPEIKQEPDYESALSVL
ncbi:MAG: thiol peroxidase [Moraxella sp.]|uniref:thiol peroxidase n=1 Tax=Moraxella sp. TaxID=479 RepID=UPI0026DC9C56|nr:thiol peroxidase [Moraxella sp.]MDO4449472.1 thiol peroxidase [Moraxella sp.]